VVQQRSGDLGAGAGADPLSRRAFLVRAGGIGLTAAAGSVLVACGGSSAGGSSGGLATVKIIQPSDVTLVLWSVDYLAEDLGFYRHEGLAAKRVPLLGGPVALQGLLSGAGACDISTPGEMLGAIAKGQGSKALMSHTNLTAATLVVSASFAKKLGVTERDPVQARNAALGRVKGASFGITAPGSQTDGFTRMALEQVGLDPDSDARIVPLQNAANCFAALQNGRIDGFMALSPLTEKAILALNAVPLLSVTKREIPAAYRLQGQTLIARTRDVERNPDLYRKLVRAHLRALRVLLEEPDRAKATLRKRRFADLPANQWELMWANNLPSWRSPYIAPDALSGWVTGGLVAGVTDPAKLSLDSAIDASFVEDAARRIGWDAPRA
jgi:NitT/TauT family transport system substrate-binding protein